MEDWLSMPKVELHAHLNGSVSWCFCFVCRELASILGEKGVIVFSDVEHVIRKNDRSLTEVFRLFDLIHILTTDHKVITRITKELLLCFLLVSLTSNTDAIQTTILRSRLKRTVVIFIYLAFAILYQQRKKDITAIQLCETNNFVCKVLDRIYGAVWTTTSPPSGPLQIRMLYSNDDGDETWVLPHNNCITYHNTGKLDKYMSQKFK